MKAVWYERNGSARDVLQFGERETASAPGPNEVRVHIRASGINPSDTKRRAGFNNQTIAVPAIVPHSDGAGVIDMVGNQVSKSRIGQRVWLFNAQFRRSFGTAAEYVTLPAELAVPLPEKVPFEAGACLGIPALTAHRLIHADGPLTAKTVLIAGGAGAVGHYAIQFAKLAGAVVITTVSSLEKAASARAAGADLVVNYKTEDPLACVKHFAPDGVDRVIEVDFAANLEFNRTIIKPNGAIAAYGSMSNPKPQIPWYPMMSEALTIRMVLVYIMPKEARNSALTDITTELEAGTLKHAVGACFSLADTAAAHEAVESGRVLGNVVVTIPKYD